MGRKRNLGSKHFVPLIGYGVCACSHGKSEHVADLIDGHILCEGCSREQEIHDYMEEA